MCTLHMCVCSCTNVYKAILQHLQCLWTSLASSVLALSLDRNFCTSISLSKHKVHQSSCLYESLCNLVSMRGCTHRRRALQCQAQLLMVEELKTQNAVFVCMSTTKLMHWWCTVLTHHLKYPGCLSSFSARWQLLS